jgi:hypothetical protein
MNMNKSDMIWPKLNTLHWTMAIEKSYTNAAHYVTPTGDILEKAKL